ncbi:MAG TPA: hypothetical protein VEP50_04235, partial [bacterium]|nr:hypothetical protein [bacterium]
MQRLEAVPDVAVHAVPKETSIVDAPLPSGLRLLYQRQDHAGFWFRRLNSIGEAHMTTLLVTHPACLEHLNPPGHPERPDRLRAIDQALNDEKFQLLAREQAPAATIDLITLCHPPDYVAEIRNEVPTQGLVRIDADTSMSPGTFEAVLRAIGGA